MLEAQRETDKRLLVAKEFVENVGSMAVGIVLVGSVAYAPNENVTELSDLDLVVIYDDVKDSVPAYFRDEAEQKYLLNANYDGYQVKRKMNGISVSIHNISYEAFKRIIQGHCGTLDYYRQSQKDITYTSLDFNGKDFVLTNTFTDCLAPDKCGIPVQKKKVQLAEIGSSSSDSNCTPGSGCC